MRYCRSLRLSLLALTAFLPRAYATDYYASPTGSGTACSEASPCSAGTAIGKPSAGDTVYFRGGTYTSSLYISKSGTSSAWITFAAYPGELPIFQTSSGLGSNTGTYLRFVGLVSTGAATGFGNGWTGSGTTNSNGHFQFVDCIADGNTANGIAFRSATGVLISECIVAHNGSSTTASWSSGVDLYGAQGTYQDNVVERTVAFENVDNQVHSDGSGFIVDDIGTGATFVNNIGFRNGGSCIRLTTSSGTHIVNNSCYHDGLDPAAANPASPGEIFFSDATTRNGVVMVNNLAAAAGYNGTQNAIFNAPSTTVSNDYAVDKNGATPFFTDPAGTNPDFRLTASASVAIDKGTTTEAPTNDIGFDPKCVTKTAPANGLSWWIYSIDYTYVQSVGGVAGCFHPNTRSGTPDIGAYEYGSSSSSGGTGGMGGAGAGSGGTSGTGSGGSAGAAMGGSAGSGTGGTGTAGTSASAGRSGGGPGGTASGGGGAGGTSGRAGATGSGGAFAAGGALGSGGVTGSGGAFAAGGVLGSGGHVGAAGMMNAGGTPGGGGMPGSAGVSAGGGVSAAGAASGTGGFPSAGAPTGSSGAGSPAGGAPSGASGANTTIGGSTSAGGALNASGGAPTATNGGNGSAGEASSGRASSSAGSLAAGGSGTDGTPYGNDYAPDPSGCGCRVAPQGDGGFGLFAALGLLGVAWSRRRRD